MTISRRGSCATVYLIFGADLCHPEGRSAQPCSRRVRATNPAVLALSPLELRLSRARSGECAPTQTDLFRRRDGREMALARPAEETGDWRQELSSTPPAGAAGRT